MWIVLVVFLFSGSKFLVGGGGNGRKDGFVMYSGGGYIGIGYAKGFSKSIG